MAVKMDRRTFMKGAAVAALAVSVSGMLTGCEDSTVEDTVKIALGEFEVSMSPKIAIVGSETGGTNGSASEDVAYIFTPSVTIKYSGSGFSGASFKTAFEATLNDEEAKLKNGSGVIAAADIPFGKSKTYAPQFGVTSKAYKAYKTGTAFKVKVTLQGQSAVFTLTDAGKVTVAKA